MQDLENEQVPHVPMEMFPTAGGGTPVVFQPLIIGRTGGSTWGAALGSPVSGPSALGDADAPAEMFPAESSGGRTASVRLPMLRLSARAATNA